MKTRYTLTTVLLFAPNDTVRQVARAYPAIAESFELCRMKADRLFRPGEVFTSDALAYVLRCSKAFICERLRIASTAAATQEFRCLIHGVLFDVTCEDFRRGVAYVGPDGKERGFRSLRAACRALHLTRSWLYKSRAASTPGKPFKTPDGGKIIIF